MMPILFQIGSFPIYSYGVLTAAAVVLAVFLAMRHARHFDMKPMQAVDAVLLLFLAGMAGSRLFFILQHPERYEGRWWHVLNLREGGLVWYGGFLLAFGASFAIIRVFRWEKWAFGDFIAPVLAAGHAVGRLGCWMNGCCYGVTAGAIHELPVQLFESVFLAALAVFLWKAAGKMRRPGDIFLLYVLLYASARFGLEFLRADQTRYGNFSIPQITSIILIVAAGFTWILRHGPRKI